MANGTLEDIINTSDQKMNREGCPKYSLILALSKHARASVLDFPIAQADLIVLVRAG